MSSLYDLPKLKKPAFPLLKAPSPKLFRNQTFRLVVLCIFISVFFGFLAGAVSGSYFYLEIKDYLAKFDIELPKPQIIEKEKIVEKRVEYIPQTSQEEKIIQAVKNVSRCVVSIIITKDRGGTGFIISEDGMILTNKHVVLDKEADYTVLTNDGRKFPAKILAQDPFQDLAVLKIEKEEKIDDQGNLSSKSFHVAQLGDSATLQMGQTVIAIGNALGEFRNTISVGVISGLGRTITASGPYLVEVLKDVIQTDAAINKGNSGGPLLNLKGEVIGINTAMVQGAQSIGFAIPVNKAKKALKQVEKTGKIVYPFLGIYYTLITDNLKEQYELLVNHGAWVGRNEYGEKVKKPIFPDSAAEKAGIQMDDIILEMDGEKITLENSLAKLILKYNPGDEVKFKILRDNEEKNLQIILGEKGG